MTDFTATGASDVLDYLLNPASAVPGAGALFISLHTADPGAAGTPSSEVSTTGTAYTRQGLAAAFPAQGATDRTATTNADITWTTATANWGTVTHFAICNTSTVNTTAATILFHSALTSSVTINDGDQAKITLGNLTITLN